MIILQTTWYSLIYPTTLFQAPCYYCKSDLLVNSLEVFQLLLSWSNVFSFPFIMPFFRVQLLIYSIALSSLFPFSSKEKKESRLSDTVVVMFKASRNDVVFKC